MTKQEIQQYINTYLKDKIMPLPEYITTVITEILNLIPNSTVADLEAVLTAFNYANKEINLGYYELDEESLITLFQGLKMGASSGSSFLKNFYTDINNPTNEVILHPSNGTQLIFKREDDESLTGGGTLNLEYNSNISKYYVRAKLRYGGLINIKAADPIENDDVSTKIYTDKRASSLKEIYNRNADHDSQSQDVGSLIIITSIADSTYNLDNNTMAIKDQILLCQGGDFQITLTSAGTIRSSSGFKTRTKNSVVAIIKIAENEFLISGDLTE